MAYTKLCIAGSMVCCSDASKQDYELSQGRVFPDVDLVFVLLQCWCAGIEKLDVAVCLWPYKAAKQEWRGL